MVVKMPPLWAREGSPEGSDVDLAGAPDDDVTDVGERRRDRADSAIITRREGH
jgi:hypothetical protein